MNCHNSVNHSRQNHVWPNAPGPEPYMHSLNGQVLFADKASILHCWTGHFQVLFRADHTVQDSTFHQIPQLPMKEDLHEPSTLSETTKAIMQLKNGKAAGVDGIPTEIWKHGGPILHIRLNELFVRCWELVVLLKDLRNAVIITLYKNKREKSDCSDYHGITLCPLLEKSWLQYFSTDWFQLSLKTSFQKPVWFQSE